MICFKQILPSEMELSRSKILTYSIRVYIWNATISINNAKIILTLPMPRALNVSVLQLCSFVTRLISASSNTKLKLNITILSLILKTNLKLLLSKVLENQLCFYLAFRLKLSGISNTYKRKYRIEIFMATVLPIYLNEIFIYSVFSLKTYCVAIFTKISDH